MSYTISYANGRTDTFRNFRVAMKTLRDEYPDLYAIHEVGQAEVATSDTSIDGELGGHRVLVWANEDESEDDAGARTVASICRDEERS